MSWKEQETVEGAPVSSPTRIDDTETERISNPTLPV